MDKPTFKTETELKIQILADYILKFHGLKHEFPTKSLNKCFEDNLLNHSAHFTPLILCGCLEKVERGLYRMKYHTPTVALVAYKAYLTKLRNKNKPTLTPDTPIEKPTIVSFKITETQAVDFLKRLGYKIMKPTTTFEEV